MQKPEILVIGRATKGRIGKEGEKKENEGGLLALLYLRLRLRRGWFNAEA